MEETDRDISKRPTVTLRQIADLVGVSNATVSRVLNFDATLSVSDATRTAIIETAEELNYLTPRRRRKLTSRQPVAKVALLHFLRPEQELVDPYYIALRLGIERRCASLNIEVNKIYPKEELPDAKPLAEADGLIVIGWHSQAEVDWIRAQGLNVVFADFHPEGDDLDSVDSDLAAAMSKLLTALHGIGYSRIAFAGWIDRHARHEASRPETRGIVYRQWMEARGLFEPGLMALGRNTEASGYDLARQLLSGERLPEIIVTGNDNMAVGAYRAIHERGLDIPGDIAVASFNDISAAQFMNPPLTTVHLPAEAIGEKAVNLLIDRIRSQDLAVTLRLESRIVWRESTRRPGSGGRGVAPGKIY